LVGARLAALVVTLCGVLCSTASAQTASAPSATCTSVTDFINTGCPLTWQGVTFYGTGDMGVVLDDRMSSEAALNAVVEGLVLRTSARSPWSPPPHGRTFVYDLQAGFDPYALRMSDGRRALLESDTIGASPGFGAPAPDAVSLDTDRRVGPKLDISAEFRFSEAASGPASGLMYRSSIDPPSGALLRF
jgi:hypothetical protein